MTRSVFDPTGTDTEHSGTRNLGPDAADLSQMPPDVADGEATSPEACAPDVSPDTQQIAKAEAELDRNQRQSSRQGSGAL